MISPSSSSLHWRRPYPCCCLLSLSSLLRSLFLDLVLMPGILQPKACLLVTGVGTLLWSFLWCRSNTGEDHLGALPLQRSYSDPGFNPSAREHTHGRSHSLVQVYFSVSVLIIKSSALQGLILARPRVLRIKITKPPYPAPPDLPNGRSLYKEKKRHTVTVDME